MYLLAYAPSKDSNQLTHSRSLLRDFVVSMKEFAPFPIRNAPSDDSDQTARTQSDQNHHWAHMLEDTFSDVVAHMLYFPWSQRFLKNLFLVLDLQIEDSS